MVGVSLVAQVSRDSGDAKAIVIQDGAGIYFEATRAIVNARCEYWRMVCITRAQ